MQFSLPEVKQGKAQLWTDVFSEMSIFKQQFFTEGIGDDRWGKTPSLKDGNPVFMHVSACCAHMCLTLACVNIPKPAKYEVAEREMDAIKHRVEEWGRGVVRGGKKRGRAFVSLKIAEDTDLNINSQRPYRALIIDYHWAFSAKANMCAMKNQLRGYYRARDRKYSTQKFKEQTDSWKVWYPRLWGKVW